MAGKNEAQALFDEAPDHEAQSLFDAAPEHVEAPPAQAATPPADPNSLDQKIRSGLQGATFGFGDNAVRAVNKLLPDSWNHGVADLIDRGLHPKEYMKPLPPPLTDAETAKMYKDAVADNPGSNFAGALLAPGVPGLKGGGALKTIANGAIQGGVAGLAQGAGDSEAETLAGKAKDALKMGVVGAAGGAVLAPVLKGAAGVMSWGAGKFTSLKDKLLADEAARIAKPMEAAVKAQDTVKDRLKKKVYDEYVASLKKAGTSPDEASKILQANEAQIQDGIEAEHRKALFGKYASEKKDLFTKVRNAEQMGAEWTPEQLEKTVSPAKAQYVQDASATVDKGLPVPPEKMTPEALKAEILRRGRAAQAKGIKSISTPPPNLDPAMVEELAQKRLAAQQASGVTKSLPALYPMRSADASLTAKGKDAAGNLVLKAGGTALAAGAGFKTGGPIGVGVGTLGLPLVGSTIEDLKNPGLQYLMAKGGGKLLDSVPARLGRGVLSGGAELVPAAIRTRADAKTYDKLRELMKTFGAPAEDVE